MNRREILAAFLGVPFALAACRSNEEPPLPAGEIVGASDVFGHRVRDGLHVAVPADAWSNIPLVIVGGGVAGLSAAWRLRNSGFNDFTLIELENAPGGTSRSGSNRLISFPWGAHYIPAPMKENAALVSLLDEMGIVEGKDKNGEPLIGEQFLCRDHYGMSHNETSAWAGLFYFCSRAPAPNTESQPLITWPEGNGRLVQHLFEKSKANVQLDRAAVELIPTDQGVDV